MDTPSKTIAEIEREEILFNKEFDEGEQLSLHQIAFDEMNIIETPFALLTKDTSGKTEVCLTPDGSVTLACINSSEFGLPNALAIRVVLALMWLCKAEHNLQRAFQFSIKHLLINYVYPGRFTTYDPNGELMQSVEKQINCVANTRIFNNRWWDNDLRRHTKVNAAIIGDVQVVEEGGKNRARIIRVEWGEHFHKSMVSQYTKSIDAYLMQKIDRPLDLMLYRILDRQLSGKNQQKYADIVEFAKNKLGMTGKKIDKGGRTAAGYVSRTLRDAVKRLDLNGYSVRMEIDTSRDAYSVEFIKIDKSEPNQVVEEDKPAALVKEFHYQSHNIALKSTRRIAARDRGEALKWLETYGFDKALWMVKRCVEVQREMKRPEILSFVGLSQYEAAAAGDYEKQREKESKQLSLLWEERLDKLWTIYENSMLEQYEQNTSDEEKEALREKVDRSIKKDKKFSSMNEAFLRPVISAALQSKKLEKVGLLSVDRFKSTQSYDELKEMLTKRHGHNPLEKNASHASK